MNTAQHTPRPWTVRDIGTQWAVSKIGARIPHAYVMRDGPDRGEANARLIAAAPELLAALEEARNFVDRHSEEWYLSGQELLAEIDAALAKATKVQP